MTMFDLNDALFEMLLHAEDVGYEMHLEQSAFEPEDYAKAQEEIRLVCNALWSLIEWNMPF